MMIKVYLFIFFNTWFDNILYSQSTENAVSHMSYETKKKQQQNKQIYILS